MHRDIFERAIFREWHIAFDDTTDFKSNWHTQILIIYLHISGMKRMSRNTFISPANYISLKPRDGFLWCIHHSSPSFFIKLLKLNMLLKDRAIIQIKTWTYITRLILPYRSYRPQYAKQIYLLDAPHFANNGYLIKYSNKSTIGSFFLFHETSTHKASHKENFSSSERYRGDIGISADWNSCASRGIFGLKKSESRYTVRWYRRTNGVIRAFRQIDGSRFPSC